jgi:hypothetical protein
MLFRTASILLAHTRMWMRLVMSKQDARGPEDDGSCFLLGARGVDRRGEQRGARAAAIV